jgi:hypothetical protein
MRSEIHKLKPEDLEETIIEKPTTHPGTNGPTEIKIGDQRGVSTLIDAAATSSKQKEFFSTSTCI